MKNILFFVTNFDAKSSGVFNSQVIEPAKFLASEGYFPMVVCVTKGDEQSMKRDLERQGIDALVFKCGDSGGFLKSFLIGVNVVIRIFTTCNIKPDYIYIRSVSALIPSFILARKCGSKLVYDFRSRISAEDRMKKRGKRSSYYFLLFFEWLAIRMSDRFSAVSNNLREYILSHRADAHVAVIPCCVSAYLAAGNNFDDRQKIRMELGFSSDEIVLVYSGGFSTWQRTEDIFEVVSLCMKTLTHVKFMVLTGAQDEARALIKKFNIDESKVYVKSLQSEEVVPHLKAADVGFLLRHCDEVNRVASPIKGAEYLAAGLMIVTSPEIGDISELIKNTSCGLILDGSNRRVSEQLCSVIGGSRQAVNDMRKRAILLAETSYYWEAYREQYKQLYS